MQLGTGKFYLISSVLRTLQSAGFASRNRIGSQSKPATHVPFRRLSFVFSLRYQIKCFFLNCTHAGMIRFLITMETTRKVSVASHSYEEFWPQKTEVGPDLWQRRTGRRV